MTASRWLSGPALLGPILLLAVCTVYGVCEVHSSTDTYIGLAGGRWIVNSIADGKGFPVEDVFNYPNYHHPWLNQNWLTHVWQYWMYTTFAPDAVIYGTWLMSASIFLFSFYATWTRSRSLLGALIAASFVAFGCHNFISARPATTGFFAISAMWALACAIEGQRVNVRWWPIVLLPVLLIVWGCAHGSFVFGYTIFGLYITYWAIRRVWRKLFVKTGHPPIWLDIILVLFTLVTCYFVMHWAVGETLDTSDYRPPLGRLRAKLCLAIGPFIVTALLYAFWVRDRARKPVVTGRQIVGLLIGLAAAFLVTLIFGPFGLENFTHGETVAGSATWREVSEWRPPYLPSSHFPPVTAFWVILGISVSILTIAWLVRMANRDPGAEVRPEDKTPELNLSAFDLLAIIIGLVMTIWARRFAPVFYIFAAPAFTTWVLIMLRGIPAQMSRGLRWGVLGAAWLAAAGVGLHAWRVIDVTILQVARTFPEFGLLELVTRYDGTPHDSIVFLENNDLSVNVLTEWTQGGMVMWQAPSSRVYMDGRAQQVYSEAHYEKYKHLMMVGNAPVDYVRHLLNEYNTEVVLVRLTARRIPIIDALEKMPEEWAFIMPELGKGCAASMLFRRDGQALLKLRSRLDAGELWLPDTAEGEFARGAIWWNTAPQDPEHAMQAWVESVNREQFVGMKSYPHIVAAAKLLGRERETLEFINREVQRAKRDAELPADRKQMLLGMLASCRRELQKDP